MKIRIHFGKNLLLRGFFQICLISLLTIDTHLLLAESPIEPAHQNPEKLPAPQNYQLSQSELDELMSSAESWVHTQNKGGIDLKKLNVMSLDLSNSPLGRLAIYRAFYSRFADREVTDQKNYGGEHYLTRRELDMMMLNLRRFFPFPKGPLEEKFRIAGFKTKSESALLRDGLTDEELEDLSKHESLSKRIFRDIQDSQTSKESLDRLERHLKESNPPRWHLLTLYFDQAIHGRLKPWEKKAIIESLLERFGENVPLTTLKYLMNFSRNPSPGVNEEQFTYSDTLFEKLLELGRVHSLDQQVEKLEESFQIVSQARRQQRDQEIFAHRHGLRGVSSEIYRDLSREESDEAREYLNSARIQLGLSPKSTGRTPSWEEIEASLKLKEHLLPTYYQSIHMAPDLSEGERNQLITEFSSRFGLGSGPAITQFLMSNTHGSTLESAEDKNDSFHLSFDLLLKLAQEYPSDQDVSTSLLEALPYYFRGKEELVKQIQRQPLGENGELHPEDSDRLARALNQRFDRVSSLLSVAPHYQDSFQDKQSPLSLEHRSVPWVINSRITTVSSSGNTAGKTNENSEEKPRQKVVSRVLSHKNLDHYLKFLIGLSENFENQNLLDFSASIDQVKGYLAYFQKELEALWKAHHEDPEFLRVMLSQDWQPMTRLALRTGNPESPFVTLSLKFNPHSATPPPTINNFLNGWSQQQLSLKPSISESQLAHIAVFATTNDRSLFFAEESSGHEQVDPDPAENPAAVPTKISTTVPITKHPHYSAKIHHSLLSSSHLSLDEKLKLLDSPFATETHFSQILSAAIRSFKIKEHLQEFVTEMFTNFPQLVSERSLLALNLHMEKHQRDTLEAFAPASVIEEWAWHLLGQPDFKNQNGEEIIKKRQRAVYLGSNELTQLFSLITKSPEPFASEKAYVQDIFSALANPNFYNLDSSQKQSIPAHIPTENLVYHSAHTQIEKRQDGDYIVNPFGGNAVKLREPYFEVPHGWFLVQPNNQVRELLTTQGYSQFSKNAQILYQRMLMAYQHAQHSSEILQQSLQSLYWNHRRFGSPENQVEAKVFASAGHADLFGFGEDRTLSYNDAMIRAIERADVPSGELLSNDKQEGLITQIMENDHFSEDLLPNLLNQYERGRESLSDLGENSKARELEKAFISERFEIYADKLHQSLNETSLMTADEANNYLLLASFMEASEEKKAIALLEKALIGDHLTDWTSTDLASFLHRYKELHEGKLSPELIAYAQVGEAADIGDALEKHGLERVVALFQEGFYGDFSKLLPFLNQDNIAGIFHELSRDNLQQLITQSIVELEKDRLENSDAAPKYQMILDYALGEKNPHPDLVGAAVADSLFQSGELTAVARTYLEKNYHKPVHPDIARWYRENAKNNLRLFYLDRTPYGNESNYRNLPFEQLQYTIDEAIFHIFQSEKFRDLSQGSSSVDGEKIKFNVPPTSNHRLRSGIPPPPKWVMEATYGGAFDYYTSLEKKFQHPIYSQGGFRQHLMVKLILDNSISIDFLRSLIGDGVLDRLFQNHPQDTAAAFWLLNQLSYNSDQSTGKVNLVNEWFLNDRNRWHKSEELPENYAFDPKRSEFLTQLLKSGHTAFPPDFRSAAMVQLIEQDKPLAFLEHFNDVTHQIYYENGQSHHLASSHPGKDNLMKLYRTHRKSFHEYPPRQLWYFIHQAASDPYFEKDFRRESGQEFYSEAINVLKRGDPDVYRSAAPAAITTIAKGIYLHGWDPEKVINSQINEVFKAEIFSRLLQITMDESIKKPLNEKLPLIELSLHYLSKSASDQYTSDYLSRVIRYYASTPEDSLARAVAAIGDSLHDPYVYQILRQQMTQNDFRTSSAAIHAVQAGIANYNWDAGKLSQGELKYEVFNGISMYKIHREYLSQDDAKFLWDHFASKIDEQDAFALLVLQEAPAEFRSLPKSKRLEKLKRYKKYRYIYDISYPEIFHQDSKDYPLRYRFGKKKAMSFYDAVKFRINQS